MAVAAQMGCSRQTVHKWAKRFEAEGAAGPEDRSCGPRSSAGSDVEPTQTQLTADAISDLIAGTSTARLLILAARDGGCIGCELASDHTQAHHIDYFENGGLTEIPNLAPM